MSQIVAIKFLTMFKNSSKLKTLKSTFTGEKQPKTAFSVIKKVTSRKTARSGNSLRHKKKRRNKKLLSIKSHNQN